MVKIQNSYLLIVIALLYLVSLIDVTKCFNTYIKLVFCFLNKYHLYYLDLNISFPESEILESSLNTLITELNNEAGNVLQRIVI